jgi:streptomycin 6-kinase
VPRGTSVTLKDIHGGQVTVEYRTGTAMIAATATDLLERARENRQQTALQGAGKEQGTREVTSASIAHLPSPKSQNGTGKAEEIPGLGVQPPGYFKKTPQ